MDESYDLDREYLGSGQAGGRAISDEDRAAFQKAVDDFYKSSAGAQPAYTDHKQAVETSGFIAPAPVPYVFYRTRPSELLDRITIVGLKTIYNTNYDVGKKLLAEMLELSSAIAELLQNNPGIDVTHLSVLTDDLEDINQRLWACEDGVRKHLPKATENQPAAVLFLEYATQIPALNDRRNEIKRAIDTVFGYDRPDVKIYG